MGFFLAGFVRDDAPSSGMDAKFQRDDRGHLVRDVMGIPLPAGSGETEATDVQEQEDEIMEDDGRGEEDWDGFEEEEAPAVAFKTAKAAKANKTPKSSKTAKTPKTPPKTPEVPVLQPEVASKSEAASKPAKAVVNKHAHSALQKRTNLVKPDKKRRKGKA